MDTPRTEMPRALALALFTILITVCTGWFTVRADTASLHLAPRDIAPTAGPTTTAATSAPSRRRNPNPSSAPDTRPQPRPRPQPDTPQPNTVPVSVTVPAVIGRSRAEAENSIRNAGLTPSIRQIWSPEPADTVLSSDPSPGTTVSRGSTVALEISDGLQPPVQTVDVTDSGAGPVMTPSQFEVVSSQQIIIRNLLNQTCQLTLIGPDVSYTDGSATIDPGQQATIHLPSSGQRTLKCDSASVTVDVRDA